MLTHDLIIDLIVIAVILAICLILWFTGRKEAAKRVILYLVMKAENIYGSGTGDIKYAYVLGAAYPYLPGIIKLFISEKQLDEWIEDGVVKLKELMAEKKPINIPQPAVTNDTGGDSNAKLQEQSKL